MKANERQPARAGAPSAQPGDARNAGPVTGRRQAVAALVPSLRQANQPNAGLWFQTALANQESGGEHAAREQLFADLLQLPVPPIYQDALSRRRSSLAEQPHTAIWEAALVDRLILGLGDETVLETGLRFEHTFGMPVIPGSSLKGACRAYVHDCVTKRLSVTEPAWHPETGEAFRAVFGDTEESGLVRFHDAWWVPAEPGLAAVAASGAEKPWVRDVMTVHHPDYYQKESPALPSDADLPTPIPFLAVRGIFLFAVTTPSPEWTETVRQLLTDMLATHGVGGKKTSGYGRFSRPAQANVSSKSEAPRADARQSLGKIHCINSGAFEIILDSGERFPAPSGGAWMGAKKKKLQKMKPGQEKQYLLTLAPEANGWTVLKVDTNPGEDDGE